MFRLDASSLRMASDGLRQAADEHATWHEKFLRTIFCGRDVDTADLEPFAHRHCSIGRWYYERAPQPVREHPSFVALGEQHERLHEAAARMLRCVLADESVPRADFEAFVAASARLRQQLDALRATLNEALQNRDPLTGAFTRLQMLPDLERARAQSAGTGESCCLVFMDVDHLKGVNDTHGHQVGDAVLSAAVHYLGTHLRPNDRVYRYGGDEFLVSLWGADLRVAQSVVNRVREGLARDVLVPAPHGSIVQVSASFGLALLDQEEGVAGSIGRADQALMIAKTGGRNRSISWDEAVTTGTRWRRLELPAVER